MNTWPSHFTWLALVETASKRCELLQIVYCSPQKGQSVRLVECYHISCTSEHYYLHAWQVSPATPEPWGWRTFRMDRVMSVTSTSTTYKPRDEGSISLRWVNDFFEIREEIDLLCDETDEEDSNEGPGTSNLRIWY